MAKGDVLAVAQQFAFDPSLSFSKIRFQTAVARLVTVLAAVLRTSSAQALSSYPEAQPLHEPLGQL